MKEALFLQYLEFEKRYSPHTLTAYRSDLHHFLTYLLQNYELSSAADIRSTHIRSWMVLLVTEGLTSRSIQRKLSTLKTYFRFLLKRNYISANPMLKVTTPKAGKRLPVSLGAAEISKLLDQMNLQEESFESMRDAIIIELLYATGMRRSELLGLTWDGVDFGQCRLKILGKGGKERLAPFGERIRSRLVAYKAVSKQQFPEGSRFVVLDDKGNSPDPKWLYNKVKFYLSGVTVMEQRSPHVLRHSFATHLSDNGADLNAIKELLGHASLAATQIYMHNSIEKLKSVYEKAHPKAKTDDPRSAQ
ncbi:MAG: tyrosine-type recombinase/integrase [Saprospiraceae bacterium]